MRISNHLGKNKEAEENGECDWGAHSTVENFYSTEQPVWRWRSEAPASTLLAQSDTGTVEAHTAFGTLRGVRQNGVLTFKGVPYAGPVDGPHRFRQAPPLEPWTGVRDALKLGPPSWQPGKTYRGIDEPSPQENCLVLTVWTPAADRAKTSGHVLQPWRRIRRGIIGFPLARWGQPRSEI